MLEQYNPIVNYIFLFFMFSAIGWAIESTYRSCAEFKFVNSGFLYGPICPIYGTGCLAFHIILVPLSEPIGKRLWLVLLLGIILADTVEYFTSWIMEKLFHARWWDYSNKFLNLHGRICFRHSCFWALFAFLYVYFIAPMYNLALTYINPTIMNVCTIIFVLIFLVDLILTLRAVADINKFMKKLGKLKETVTNIGENVKNKADISKQFAEIKAQFSDLENSGTRNTRRLFTLYGTVKKAAEDSIYEAEAKWESIKSIFSDTDGEMM